jgi:glycosyltransferase involved in cell wall biosynthesis
MRILHISTRLILGGSQENTVLSCEGQSRLGHDVHLAFGPIFGPEGSLLDRVKRFRAGAEARRDGGTKEGSAEGGSGKITTHEVPDLCREVNPRKDKRALGQLRMLIRDLRPDIVHTHSSKAGILGRIAAWSVSSPEPREIGSWLDENGEVVLGHATMGPYQPGIVHTIHGPPFMPMEGSAFKRARIALVNRAYVLAERRAARNCHAIVSVADAMTKLFLSKEIGTPEQYTTVYSGMEVEPFLDAARGESRGEMRAELGLAAGDIVVGTIARLAQHKGHDDLLDALGDALRARPSLKLLWIGDGWWRERLMAKVRSMGLEQSVICTGLVPPERIPGLTRAMDILAHPSYREGLPRTVPQALLCGVPVVAYDCDGTGEACIDGETGLLVRTGDRAGLGRAILTLADDPGLRRTLGDAGRELCRDRFSAGAMVRGLETVYARALSLARA